jgi:hypothetical protein
MFIAYAISGQQINDGESNQIHQAVVAQLKRTDGEKSGINMRG